jgi:hypothetical protein
LPSTDSILDLDVGSLLKPDYIEHHIEWSQAVSDALGKLRKLCVEISAVLLGDTTEQVAEFEKTLMMAAQHAKQLTAMRTRFEWLSAMSELLQRHKGFFNHGGELYAGHDSLRLGITQSAFRRIAVSYSNFMWLIGYPMEERLDDTVQDDAMVASHQWLMKEGWQVRLADDGPEFAAFSSDKFFGANKKAAPARWKVHMLELNSDILDASKKVVLGSLCAGKQTEETRVLWGEVLRDLARFVELRSKVLAGRPISKNPQKVKKAPLPPRLQDDWDAPPVVMWCAPLNAKQAQPASKKPRHQMEESAGTGSASWSSSGSSWSTWWGR